MCRHRVQVVQRISWPNLVFVRVPVEEALRSSIFGLAFTVKTLFKNPIRRDYPTLRFLTSITSDLAG